MKFGWQEQCIAKAKKKSIYSKGRELLFNNLGYSNKSVEDLERVGVDTEEVVWKRSKDIQTQINSGRIEKVRYNKRYKALMSNK